jgi:hypothetical protein
MHRKIIYLIFFILFQNLSLLQSQDTIKVIEKYKFVIFDWEIKGDSIPKESGEIIANSIRTNLFKANCTKKAEILEREEIIAQLAQTSFTEKLPDVFEKKIATSYGKILQAQYVIFGKLSFSINMKFYLVSMKLIEVKTGQIVATDEIEIPIKIEYARLISKVSDSIVRQMIEIEDIFCDQETLQRLKDEKAEQREEMRLKTKELEKIKQKALDKETDRLKARGI